MKRIFDFLAATTGIILLTPLLIIIALSIVLDSKGGVFFKQIRVGRHNKDFHIIKFRSMSTHAEKDGQLTVGSRDSRITRIGYYLRRYKLDELPQLFNVITGDMSIVGPRPEVRKYVTLYSPEQLKVLQVRPGLTDYASLEYIHENDILQASENPEKTYIQEIMPAKLRLNLQYIQEKGLKTDLSIIFATLRKIIT